MSGNEDAQIRLEPTSGFPKDVVFEILVRILLVKTIALCKCVCKSWRDLISDPRFAKLHLARSKICLLVRNIYDTRIMRRMYLLEDEDGSRGFYSSHCICRPEKESCEICRSDTTAITELNVPVGPLWVNTIMNTCDGLLCLYSYRGTFPDNSPIVVCNPVTGELTTLPNRNPRIILRGCGLGLDPKTSQYKVVVLYQNLPIPKSEDPMVLKAIVHVLGTYSWRELDTPDMKLDIYPGFLTSPALLDGALCWVCMDKSDGTCGMISFNLDSECLCYRSFPPSPLRRGVLTLLNVAVLGGRLCVYPSHPCGKLDMCVIDERSASDSSPEWISYDLSEVQYELQLIRRIDNGALLMYNGFSGNDLIYYDPPRGSPRFKRLMCADGDRVEVVAYTPSFVSLKDILRPRNAEVL